MDETLDQHYRAFNIMYEILGIDDVEYGDGTEIINKLKSQQSELTELRRENKRLSKEVSRRGNLLEDVINELGLSEQMIHWHGQHGTEPSVLVRLVLEEKDLKIRMLAR